MFKKILNNFEEIISSSLFILIFTLVIIEVIRRYFTGASIYWVQEVTQTMFVWSVFIGAGAAIKRGGLISIDILFNVLPHKVQVLFNAIIMIVLLMITSVLGYEGLKFMMEFGQDTMPMTGFQSWYLYAAVPIGTLFIIFRIIQTYGSAIINHSKLKAE